MYLVPMHRRNIQWNKISPMWYIMVARSLMRARGEKKAKIITIGGAKSLEKMSNMLFYYVSTIIIVGNL